MKRYILSCTDTGTSIVPGEGRSVMLLEDGTVQSVLMVDSITEEGIPPRSATLRGAFMAGAGVHVAGGLTNAEQDTYEENYRQWLLSLP